VPAADQITISPVAAGTFAETLSANVPAIDWDFTFRSVPAAPSLLAAFKAPHIRMQLGGTTIPQTSATTWDFTALDQFVQASTAASAGSPMLQIASAPSFLYQPNTQTFADPTFNTFAAYSQNLVRYYNLGGFTAPDGFHQPATATPIAWWSIYNEPNYQQLSPTQYVALYNTVVPAMLAVDPSLHFAALEGPLCAPGFGAYVDAFLGGVSAPVDVIAAHFYASINRSDADATLFATVPVFAQKIASLKNELEQHPNLAETAIWVTETNISSDFPDANGFSSDNPGVMFVPDPRGSNAFAAAWRPYVFSQLGKAGAAALYPWNFAGNVQYGDLNGDTGQLYLTYWIDLALSHFFNHAAGAEILSVAATNAADIETLALRQPDGSVLLMLVNHALANPSDNNGGGAPRVVQLDLSALGTFTSGSTLTIDANTDLRNGPLEETIAPVAAQRISFLGYGVSFSKLVP
jgi:hypothetical protein